MSISASAVKELREKTGAGMMECKKALTEASGDFEKAIEILRKRGLSLAAKKASRKASEGTIGEYLSNDASFGTLLEVNCETDFVAKNDDFQNFVAKLVEVISKNKPASVDALMELSLGSETVASTLTNMIAKIGENLGIRRFALYQANAGEKLAQYIHPGNKIGVLVRFVDPSNKLSADLGRDVAMHVAAMNPQYLDRNSVPENVLLKEKEIQKAQMAGQNKPEEILNKIVEGKIGKYFSEVCLQEQIFVKDPEGKQAVSKYLKGVDAGIEIKEFVRYQVGEGIE
ncbi:MAG: elongation factor Ts [Deltaproteobacteria bacterium CG_4_10_14_0_2_um_filter_43_8]|nr:MAG: elongation factor Ts [Deltaproteobacteria bacterium CG11_big_fil_rev_8_21_14_0_20_42_23]PJA18737.1 MAG: elongation factor Ts [Deltaproteobacteria bacterium CG_4_10_14_0_2_um_filter_43_8]PJC64403.1 MAG: elongation factor Ts [Deltaproteobacteria bacterium CG_4_9_14_0_2_um_filter_42_21]